jgi:phytoene dehydrogenase-like protein
VTARGGRERAGRGDHDAIVVGAGHNGLTAALTLAGKGRRVLVVERSAAVGGLCATYEFAPGYRVPGLLPDTSGYRAHLARALRLEEFGLATRDEEPPILAETETGFALLQADLWHPLGGEWTEADREALLGYRSFLRDIGPFVRRVLDSPPPPLEVPEIAPRALLSGGLVSGGLAQLPALAGTGWALRRLGRRTMTEVLRVLPMCVADWMRERFESEALATAIAAPALLGSYNGPWAAGTAAALMFRECAAGRSIAGGPAALVTALVNACRVGGVEIRTGSPVDRIVVDQGRVRGVHLTGADGPAEVVEAPVVVATCNPKTALLDLVGPRHLDATTERELGNYRCRGTTAVLLLAVEGSVEVPATPGRPIERLRLGAARFDDLERAFDAVKYGQVSERPFLEVWIPSIESPELAPAGCHVVAALVSCAPYDLAGGWSTEAREALTQVAVHRINRCIPGLRDHLAGGRLLAPPDLERLFALPGGHLLHGEPALDQLLFLRPSLHLSRYATPIEGLFLGGAGSHPGGGITGMPGRLAALRALAGGRAPRA